MMVLMVLFIIVSAFLFGFLLVLVDSSFKNYLIYNSLRYIIKSNNIA